MAINNIPSAVACGCDELRINMSLAAGLGAPAGDAATYGAFQAAMEINNRSITAALNPIDCGNKIYMGADGIPKITHEYHLPDCTEITDACADGFSCDPGLSATPTMVAHDFKIEKCSFIKLSLTPQDWNNTCCGLEEYYKMIAEARPEGTGMARDLRGIVSRALNGRVDWDMYSLQAKQIAERVGRHFNDPVTGKLRELNEYILGKMYDGKGYNFVKKNDGTVVGNNTWEIPAFVPRFVNNCNSGEKVVDANALRRHLERWAANHPDCGGRFIFVAGDWAREMIAELGIMSCCTPDGVDQDAVLRRALGLMSNLVYDSMIDDIYGKGSFFIIEENALQFFWLTLFNNPEFNRPDSVRLKMGGVMKTQEKNALNDFGVTRFNIANCNTGTYGLAYDTFFNTQNPNGCDNRSFNFQFEARYGMWTRPAIDCGNYKGRTGIYFGQIVDAC